jgi:predicted dehydrogenase
MDSQTPGVLLLGAGNRGRVYTDWILRHPGRLHVAGVAEPDDARREYIRRAHRLSTAVCFADWKDALAANLPAEAVIVSTQDQMHVGPAVQALERGLHVLLEKPIAPGRPEVLAIAQAATGASGSLTVCHVLRYSSFFNAVKDIVTDGVLGDIQSIFHAENVAYYHFAHSYVRGSWSNSNSSSPIILAKSCHDLDILCWIADAAPVRVSSVAGQGYFTEAHAPAGAPALCSDGCPAASTCLYEAERTYLHGVPLKTAVGRGSGPLAMAARLGAAHPRLAARIPGLSRYAVWKEWPTSAVTTDLTPDGIRAALREGPYGRCVYRCDNDQPDHQDTIITFANGITAAFRLHGRSHEEGRTLRIDGSKATLRGKFGSGTVLELHPHGSTTAVSIPVKSDLLGHSEADDGLMEAWSGMVSSRATGGPLSSDAATSVTSHLLAFAAHESVVSGQTQDSI